MPTFFIDTYDGRRAMADRFGIELTSIEEAADEAASLLPDFAREVIPGSRPYNFAATVRSGSDKVVYEAVLLFRERYATPSDDIEDNIVGESADVLIMSRLLRAESASIRDRIRRATNELQCARIEASATRRKSHAA